MKECPKCGCGEFVGPVYVGPGSYSSNGLPRQTEQLKYTCNRCGYQAFTPTKDRASKGALRGFAGKK